MPNFSINVFALVGAAVAKMALGALWYSPALFLGSSHPLCGGCDGAPWNGGEFLLSLLMMGAILAVWG